MPSCCWAVVRMNDAPGSLTLPRSRDARLLALEALRVTIERDAAAEVATMVAAGWDPDTAAASHREWLGRLVADACRHGAARAGGRP